MGFNHKTLILMVFLLVAPFAAKAQKVSVGTDFMQWANFGTANLELDISVQQHVSLSVGGRYNPWEFGKEDASVHYQQLGGYVGCRYWPWYVYSGWWLGAKVQYMDFSKTGIWRPALEEGQRLGTGLSFGYTVMLNENLNLEFGAGAWCGYMFEYALYECPVCMEVRRSGPRHFADIDNVSVSLFYVF